MGEKSKIVEHGKVMNLQKRTVHGVLIYQGCVSVEVDKSENDEYVFF